MATPVVRSSPSFGGNNTPTKSATARHTEPVMPSLSEMSAASGSSAFVDDYSQFQQTYASYNENGSATAVEEEQETIDECDSSNSTFLDLVMSLYLPILVLWLKRSVLGTTNFIRSLIVGHFLRLLFGNTSEWMIDKTPAWLHAYLWQPHTSNGKIVLHAWPPPALTALALLTVFALVVHPDGYTWIVLGKLRDAMLSLLQSSMQCWEVVVQDYGVLPTVVASATLAALVFLVFVVLRTLSPRGAKRPPPQPEKKKKKRKGHARHRGSGGGGGGRIKTPPTPPAEANNIPSSKEPLAIPASPSKAATEAAPDRTALTRVSSATQNVEPVPSPVLRKEDHSAAIKVTEETVAMPLTPIETKTNEKVDKRRMRVSSVSTLDTTVMSDDLSCESTSIRSHPPAGVNSTTTRSIGDQETTTSVKSSNKPKPSNNRRQKRGVGGVGGKSKISSAKAVDGPSRWDALKPTHNVNPQPQQNHNHHHHPNHHHNNIHNPRPRRGGGVGAGPKKGRNNHNHSESRSVTLTPSRKSTRSPNRSTVRSPVSPPAIVHQTGKNRPSPAPSSLPHPPPGLGLLPVSGPPGFTYSNNNNPDSLLLPAFQTTSSPSRWDAASLPKQDAFVISSSFLNLEPKQDWGNQQNFMAPPTRFGATTTPQYPHSPAGSIPFGTTTTVKENPFAPETNEQANLDSQIEADLQELGGQMAGSILDF